MMLHKTRLTLVASLLASLLMAGCEAQGDGELSDGLDNNGNTTLFPNDGMAPTQVTDNGTAIAGSFICEGGIQAVTPNATTEVGSGGLVGGPLTNLLNLVGGDTVTQLLNSVSEKDAVIDNNLATFSTYSLTLGLLAVLTTVRSPWCVVRTAVCICHRTKRLHQTVRCIAAMRTAIWPNPAHDATACLAPGLVPLCSRCGFAQFWTSACRHRDRLGGDSLHQPTTRCLRRTASASVVHQLFANLRASVFRNLA